MGARVLRVQDEAPRAFYHRRRWYGASVVRCRGQAEALGGRGGNLGHPRGVLRRPRCSRGSAEADGDGEVGFQEDVRGGGLVEVARPARPVDPKSGASAGDYCCYGGSLNLNHLSMVAALSAFSLLAKLAASWTAQVVARETAAQLAACCTTSCARRQLCSRLRRGGCAVSQRSAGKIGDKPLEYPQAFRSSQGRSKARGISYVSAVELLMNTNFSSSPGAELAVELISIVASRVFLE